MQFSALVEEVRVLSHEEKLEMQKLLERSLIEDRRRGIAQSHQEGSGPLSPEEEQRLDAWYDEIEEMAQQMPAGDFDRLDAALEEADREAKEYVRRHMGLD